MFNNIPEIEALGFWSYVLVEWIKELWHHTPKCECGHRELWHQPSEGGYFKWCTIKKCGCIKSSDENLMLLDKDEIDPTVLDGRPGDVINIAQYKMSDERARELYEQIRNVADEYVKDPEVSKRLANAVHYHYVGMRPCSPPKIVSLSEDGDRSAKLVYSNDGDSLDARIGGYEAADSAWYSNREVQRKKLEDAGFILNLDLSMDDQWYVEGKSIYYCKVIPTLEEVIQRERDIEETCPYCGNSSYNHCYLCNECDCAGDCEQESK